MVQLLLSFLMLIFLSYAPGWAWSQLFYHDADLLNRHYDRLIASALWTGWLALLLAALHSFSLSLHCLLTLLFCAVGLGLTRWRGAGPGVSARPASRLELVGYAGLLLIFGLIVARPFETVLGGRDAGVYPNIGYSIARTGSIVQTEPIVAELARNRLSEDKAVRDRAAQAFTNFLGKQQADRYMAERFTQPSFFINNEQDALEGRVAPGFFHLYPAWLGLWTALFGLHGGLIATGYLGLLGAWSVAMTARRMSRPAASVAIGLFALALIVVNPLQLWFSRYTTAEAGTQMLLWGGLAAWVRFADLPPDRANRRARLWFGALTGLAIGQLLLMRLEFYWGVGPLLVYLGWQAVRRRWTEGDSAMALALTAMLTHGAIHVRTTAWTYFLDNTWGKLQDYAIVSRIAHSWYSPFLQDYRSNNKKGHTIFLNDQRFAIELALVGLALVALWTLWRWPGLLSWIERQIARWRRPLLLGAIAVGLLIAGYGYFIRPQHLTTQSVLHPLQESALWASYIGAPLPIPFDGYPKQQQRAVVLGNMVRLGWYLSPLGIFLGVAGVAWWIWRDLNRRTWLVLGVALAYGSFAIIDTYGTAEQVYPYIARRFLPGAVPLFTLGAAWTIGSLVATRGWRRLSGLGLGALLMVFFVATGWRAVRHVEYGGAIDGIAALAERIEPDAVVLMRGGDRDTPTNIATPLRYAFNRDVLVVYSTNPQPYRDQLAAQVRAWIAAGRPVYLLLGVNGGTFDLPGVTLEDRGLFDLQVLEWQQLQSQKPFTAGPIRFNYHLYAVQPQEQMLQLPLQIDVTSYQYQRGGWYPLEQDSLRGGTGRAYMWSNGAGRVALPTTNQETQLHLELATGTLPPSLQQAAQSGALQVCPTLTSGAPTIAAPALECRPLTSSTPTVLSWDLPTLPAAGAPWELSISSRTWQPAEYRAELNPPSNDARTLGIQWFGASLTPRGP